MKVLCALSAMTLLGAAACGADEDNTGTTDQDITSVQHTSDAVNPPGTDGFYWLTNFVATNPTPTGTFNGGYKSRLTVDILDMTCDTFAVTESPAHTTFSSASVLVYTSISTYRVNTSVTGAALVNGHCYRVEPKLDGVALGFRDIIVTSGTAPTGVLRFSPTANIVIPWTMYGNITPDQCPSDPNKTAPGFCGCGFADVDADGDGNYSAAGGGSGPSCTDLCDNDPNKSAPGTCGCGVSDTGDTDGDGTLDCVDSCPNDARFQTTTGVCGCNAYSIDLNEDGTPDSCSNANTCTLQP